MGQFSGKTTIPRILILVHFWLQFRSNVGKKSLALRRYGSFFELKKERDFGHQLCIPRVLESDGQHCLTANRRARPWKMLCFKHFCRQKTLKVTSWSKGQYSVKQLTTLSERINHKSRNSESFSNFFTMSCKLWS